MLGGLEKTWLGEKEGTEKHRHGCDSRVRKNQRKSVITKPFTFSLLSFSILASALSH